MTRIENDYILLENRKEIVLIRFSDINYLESGARKVFIHTDETVHWEYGKLDEFAKLFPENFFRSHKRCLINLNKVKKMEKNTIQFTCGETIGMSKEKYSITKQAYKGYMIRIFTL